MVFTFRRSGLRPLPKECRSILLCACAALLFITGCSRPAGSSRTITIEHEISPEPARIGPAEVTFRLVDPAAKAITRSAHRGRGGHVAPGNGSRVWGSQGNRTGPLPGSSHVSDGGGLGYSPAYRSARRAKVGTPDRREGRPTQLGKLLNPSSIPALETPNHCHLI